jgi:hypothetical protein
MLLDFAGREVANDCISIEVSNAGYKLSAITYISRLVVLKGEFFFLLRLTFLLQDFFHVTWHVTNSATESVSL